jgi:hypothetical protein
MGLLVMDPAEKAAMRGRRTDAWVFAGYLVYTLLNAYPYSMPDRIGRILPDWGDPLLYLMYLKWYGYQLFRDPRHAWDVPVFYPIPRAGTFSDFGPGFSLVAAPLAWVTGSWVAAHNLMLLSGFLLSAWWTYRLAGLLGADPFGAAVAGLLYGFCSARFHFLINLKLQWGPLIPLFFYVLTRFLQTGRPGLLAGTFLVGAFQFLCTLYYGLFLVTTAPLYAAFVEGQWRDRRRATAHRPWAWVAALAVVGFLTWVLLEFVVRPYIDTSAQYGLRPTPAWLRATSARPPHYLVSQARLAFPWASRWYDAEHVLWPGLLSVFALAAPPWWGVVPAALWACAVLTFVVSLGPHTPVFPWVSKFLPYLVTLRNPVRWGLMTLFFLALLAGLGLSRCLRRIPGRFRKPVAVLILGLGVLELWHAPLRHRPVPEPPPIVRRLAAAPEPGAVLPIPPYPDFAITSVYTYWESFHWKPTIYAIASWSPPGSDWIRSVLRDFPAPHVFWLMAHLNVRYVLVYGSVFHMIGQDAQWEWYQRALLTVPAEWIQKRAYQLQDVLLVLDLEHIRRDFRLNPPKHFRWRSPRPEAVLVPTDPDARAALTDGRWDTAWVTRDPESWQVVLDFGEPVHLQALRLGKAPKEQMFWLAGSMDGRSWSPVYAVPWSVWAGARLLPDGTVYPAYRWDPERVVLLCAANTLRYLRVTSSPVAGHVVLSEVQAVWVPADASTDR